MGIFNIFAARRAKRQQVLESRINERAIQIAGASVAKLQASVVRGGTVWHNVLRSSRSGGAKSPNGLTETGGILLDHQRLRTNARDAYQDSPQAKAIVDRYADVVADIGLVLEPAPKADLLGLTMEEAEAWSAKTADMYDSWARSIRQHRSETMSWYQSHRLYQIFQHRDNDIFVRFYYSQDRGLLNPLQWEFIDPNQIRGDMMTTTSLVNAPSEDGIDRDSRGRESAYRIWVFDPATQRFRDIVVKKRGPKSGRIMMLHGFTPDYAGQGRGYSRLAHALQEFSDLTDFSLATVKKAINQSQITMYVKPSQDAPASNPFQDILTNAGAGPAAKQFGADPTPSDDAENVATANPVSFYEMPEAMMTEPGATTVFNLADGEDLRAFENKIAAESFDRFVDSFCSYLCASHSMPLEVLLMKFNQNYSASRGTLLLFWRVATIWREEMIVSYCTPTYEMWLAGEIAANRISCPGWTDPRMRAAWLNARWVGTPMPNIDPDKTASADMKYVEMGAQTLERVARNHNGSSGKANRAKLKREIGELTKVPWSKNADADRPKRDGEDQSKRNNEGK